MTETERSRIVELQHQGYGYKKISTLTGLPLNTVAVIVRCYTAL